MKKNELFKTKTFFFKIISCFILLSSLIIIIMKKAKKKIGVVGLFHDYNAGNILVKFSIYTKLKEFGFDPIIIAMSSNHKINFLQKHLKLKMIKINFFELSEKDYDIIMVNSDQTWNLFDNNVDRTLNVGYLQFAENWKIPRFVYGASLGVNYWRFSSKFDIIARRLLKKFSGVSVREIGAIKMVEKHLGVHPELVLDPTLIIDKNYYLDLIKNFKINFNLKEKFLCIYQLDRNIQLEKLVRYVSQSFNYKVFKINRFEKKFIENFILCIKNSNAVITDSFHGTIFSIIFKKPFITYINKHRGSGRFISLIKIFNLGRRIVDNNNFRKVNINLLKTPLNINQTLLNYLKNKSINFLKNNLNIK